MAGAGCKHLVVAAGCSSAQHADRLRPDTLKLVLVLQLLTGIGMLACVDLPRILALLDSLYRCDLYVIKCNQSHNR
jgi:hypothetical protein